MAASVACHPTIPAMYVTSSENKLPFFSLTRLKLLILVTHCWSSKASNGGYVTDFTIQALSPAIPTQLAVCRDSLRKEKKLCPNAKLTTSHAEFDLP
jgi:hypothetical protein